MLLIESLPLLEVCLHSAHYQERARIHMIWTISEYHCVVADKGEANWRQRFSNNLLSRGIDASPGHVPVLFGITATTQFTNFRSVSRQKLKNMTCTPLARSAQRARVPSGRRAVGRTRSHAATAKITLSSSVVAAASLSICLSRTEEPDQSRDVKVPPHYTL